IDSHSQRVFEAGAKALMPQVSYTHLDGTSAEARAEALSGADIFTFPIDNIQETFGLAPIEAMAAGLPVVVSDWDGMKDTVSADAGIRVTTRSVPGPHRRKESFGYHVEGLNYAQYGNNTSALTEIDLGELTRAFVTLARDPDKRRAMGEAGRKRAQRLYDWAAIIPQYQDFWGELSAIRRAAVGRKVVIGARLNPVAPPPMELFKSYPSQPFAPGIGRCVATPATGLPEVEEMFALRRYDKMKQPFERPEKVASVLGELRAAGSAGADAPDIAEALEMPTMTVERIFAWLLKFGYARFAKGEP
ncbi:MAG TPA: glycosyltransferase, partial [Rhodobacterales bacterium]|nr:glycosyltransferase [Rhodobacterales bacterium]